MIPIARSIVLSYSAVLIFSAGSNSAYGQINESKATSDTAYVFFNHAAKQWDKGSVSKQPTQILDSVVRAKKIASFMTAADEKPDSNYFLSPSKSVQVLRSIGGSHNLSLPNLRSMTFVGGYLEFCLCEAIRDVILGAPMKSQDHPLRLFLSTEAIYMNSHEVYEFLLVELEKNGEWPGWPTSFFDFSGVRASDVFGILNDDAIIRYLSKHLFDVNDTICPDQWTNGSSHSRDEMKMDHYSISIIQNGKSIGVIGKGSSRIEIVLEDLRSTASRLSLHPPRSMKAANEATTKNVRFFSSKALSNKPSQTEK